MIGQYAHGNEPSHHVAYLYNKVNQPWKTQQYVSQIMDELYLNTPAGLCGMRIADRCRHGMCLVLWAFIL